jgi:flagellar hook-associated protein 3 FlgL
VTTQLQGIQTLVVTAGNASYTLSDRQALATELEGRLNDLMGLANMTDGTGGYLFSGYKSTTAPFAATPTGAQYQGDQGDRNMQVGAARTMPVTVNGSAIFENNPTGNGRFQTQAAAANTGTGVISPGSVTDQSKVTGHAYSLAFTVSGAPPATTYTVTDNSVAPAVDVLKDVPYQEGAQIAFDGITMDVKGAPANGDTFSVAPSAKQSVFTTVKDLIATLRMPADTAAGKSALTNGLNTASSNLKNSLDTVLTVQASVGANLKELDYLDSSGDDLDTQYTAALSGLQDLDMVKAISMYQQQQTTLQAAQQSFKVMSGLSLFNYIGG